MKSEKFTYDVFISYASKDKAVIHPPAERLRDDGVKVWLDVWVFKPGDTSIADRGIDLEIEFNDDQGEASGKRLYLQLESGDSHLRMRKRDEAEIFQIKDPRRARYWVSQRNPEMLVVRTSDKKFHWMTVTKYLKVHGVETKQIEFEGEPFAALNVHKMRRWTIGGS
ncbi:MAG: DUF4365 domain-containing protein [Geminicoccales bacterium]